ncbi:MAG: 1,4-dihydroxy-6-naphthoate synthase [Saprospiraceae bacterium]|jgi:1,4-dihydroxy-6-naphthoate synthase|nr:1,4-dihydroxy-6-naphthoate synthase [Saprospiraceae bacterium]MBK8670800.1 1,4-dihydroxy-6-naphthoate synthase [Saprospiraceae bacterium]MBL0101555.1 1,4-dihydroxy-6-naphthoate synthase [Saprospiraceae bacterium]
MKLSFAFSPCPNDTFMFEPIVRKRIDLFDLEFDIIMEDVENLNKAALQCIPDITKLSFNAFTKIYDKYQLLNSGSALGNHCGPLLISSKSFKETEIKDLQIAIPGYNTTAFLLLKYAYPEAENFVEMVFSDVEKAILSGQVDAGVIIHENRFTYESKGLRKIMDLGENWETRTGSPIPLGGIAIRRDLPEEIKLKVNTILYNSVQYAFDHPQSGLDFIATHAQEMDKNVMFAHIDLYVNHYSQFLGQDGKNAVESLFKLVHPDNHPSQLKTLFVS